MNLYIRRETSKLLKRVSAETTTEIILLGENWKYLLGGLVCQYIHGLAARGVHYIHRPGPVLQDVGFYLLPELGPDKAYLSETLFSFVFLSFFLWTFHPFILKTKKIYTVLLWCRVLAFLVASQILRILTFYSTQLPGPNYHCREIYGTQRFIKQLAWLLAIVQSFLIVASRKHYTVDVVVAWYTVNLVVFFVDKKLPELPDRTNVGVSTLLPLSTKDTKTKDENHKLINGNTGDSADRRSRTQVNGKILEEGNAVQINASMNGGA